LLGARRAGLIDRHMIRVFLVGLLAAAALPSTALAENAAVSLTGSPSQLTYAGSSLRDAIFFSGGNPPALILDRNGEGALLTAGAGCKDVFGDGKRVSCNPAGGATINLNGADDFFSGGTDTAGMTVNGGAGNDQIIPSGSTLHWLNGDAGDDTFNLAASPNRDVVDGGEGNDSFLWPRGGTDEFIGGAGVDALTLPPDRPGSVSLDDQANDGPANDLKFNARSDVENVLGSDGADALTGSAAANVLDGAKGNDAIDGGGGGDTLRGGEGDDQIEAQDGVKDVVECGLGSDRANVDAIDAVSGCETVVRPAEEVKPPEEKVVIDLPGPPVQVLPTDHDFDHDGVLAGADCRDTDPAIRPGATDTPGDGIDQDCSGADAAFPRLTAKLTYGYLGAGRNTVLTALELRELQDATVEVRCSGCSIRKTVAKASGVVKLSSAVKGRKLRPGTVITVTISRPGYVTEVRKLTIRPRKKPTLTALCQAPGAKKASAC
jgi:hypothetical protein